MYEREIGVDRGYVSGNTNRLLEFTADVNSALDEYISVAIRASGRWQFDDSNHTDYPIILTNLVANQRDYSFTSDENGNLILDIYKVLVADSSGTFREIKSKDAQFDKDTQGYWDGQNTTGTPNSYDKTANGIFLDPVPDVNVTNGLKIYINREGSYFTSADTTKKPGVPGIHHHYFYLKPAMDYARRQNLAIYPQIQREVIKLIGDEMSGNNGLIQQYFSERSRDEVKRLTVAKHNNR